MRRGGRGATGPGTPRFRYDKKRGVYVYKQQGGSLFNSIKRKGLTRIVLKVIKAAKPIGKVIVKKGIKAAKNPRNRRRLMMMATNVCKSTVGRITGGPQLC